MSAFSVLPGAVADGPLVQHFGDPIREQRALERGAAVAPLGDRTVIELAGSDRLTWLDSITSQSVARLAAGQSTELLVLDPQGHVEHVAAVLDDGGSTWLIADAADAEPLATWLQRMVFRADVQVSVHPELAVVGFFAGGTAEQKAEAAALAPHGVPVVWTDPWPAVQPGGHQYHVGADHPGAAYHWRTAVLDEAGAAALATDAELERAGALAAEALRIAAWRPRWAAEVDDRSIPHETDWIRSAVHLNKGCYRGQETVAKVHNLGHPPRRIAALHLDGSDDLLPDHGAPVLAGDDEVGRITSAARHHELGPIALAILSRRAPAGDLVVRTPDGDIAAAQEIIVPADAGATADVPRLTRLSRRPSAPDPRDAR
ncbi:YgfZ/GcvT domain-containing protein [Microbacterium sp. ASV81]|uniref:Glycine cleavage T C-terminal barrel domain-containing protein n=1 Tax=Microbacterium capsulatum TaxID=3041921 RepID=A0ABU0XH10_9MICO|nr:glycine cleavage T C-terminal barrel domain-containing protein [Microbacterium sp. ASV81]MDQ4214419.1 glycine cleavage T C-terminal barrel domain-containing protein [Microbacterium sp. ASV81]